MYETPLFKKKKSFLTIQKFFIHWNTDNPFHLPRTAFPWHHIYKHNAINCETNYLVSSL